jgi:signal transduction histidine kinase
MVSYIVEAHGGAMELDSEEGAGRTFRMVLPASA